MEWYIPVVLRNISKHKMEIGEYNSARNTLNKAIKLSNKLMRKDTLYECQLILSNIEFIAGNYDKSEKLAELARKGFAEVGMLTGIKSSQNMLDKIDSINNE